ncbi:hypothetical protein N4S66_15275 [Shewanella algae]|uniref:Uncharacterized protein n=2 Tax=Unclassified Bacteria TaxID=49928 RepID=A0AAU6VV18_UNCXX|nr:MULTISPECIES: hypothetical protein [Shewanella]MCT8981821.1 hypothetical protein [Shewanella algae]MDE0569026.1 hypothetical protein [Shewanella sp. K8]
MIRILSLLSGLFISVACHASPPAKPIEITPGNIDELGFSIEIKQVGVENYVRLVVPSTIDQHWVPVTTQAYTYNGEESGLLNKVELGSPTKEVSINSYYKPSDGDLMVGVYFLCGLDRAPCRGDWDSRLYMIQSINQYLITKKGSRTH